MKRVGLCFVGLRMALVSLFLLVKIFIYGQIRWDGEAGDGQWSNPQNWAGDIIPGSADEVILDNNFVNASYKIYFPSGNSTVSIRSLQIIPGFADSIFLEIPVTSTISPGLQITGTGYPLTIGDRGVLINASGSGSGASLTVSDSIRIGNGGCYIHRTPRAHAALVTLLSRAPGTEEGIFCFDVPDVSSTISLSDRTFGKLQLLASAAGGNLNYTAAATKKIRVRSDLFIGRGVKLNLNCTDTLHVLRNLEQEGGILNLSTSTRVLVLSVGGKLQVLAGGLITESGSVSATIFLGGNTSQDIRVDGQISNQVSLVLNNPAGCQLKAALNVPYSLELKKGRLLSSSASQLVISAGAILKADSLNLTAFVEGPVRLDGLSVAQSRVIPVGAGNELRWLSLKQATGNFIVQYQRSDPRTIDNRVQGLHHISAKEYWSVQSDGSPVADAKIELSFNDANQSGITDMNSLHVARLESTGWKDAGHSAFSGSAGGRGSVVSDMQSIGGTGEILFTLASTEAQQNPLPIHLSGLKVLSRNQYDILQYGTDSTILSIEIQQRMLDGRFEKICMIDSTMQPTYAWKEYRLELSPEDRVFRLQYIRTDQVRYLSREFLVRGRVQNALTIGPIAVSQQVIELSLQSNRQQKIRIAVFDVFGRKLLTSEAQLNQGRQKLQLSIPERTNQVLIIQVVDDRGERKVIRFLGGK